MIRIATQQILRVLMGVALFYFVFWGILLSGAVFNMAQADTARLNLTLKITMPPQCFFSGGSSSAVSFGQVQQALIDGVSYKRMPINMDLNCPGLEKNGLRMTLSWDDLSMNNQSAVITNRKNLGIAIYNGSNRQRNNSSINFKYGSEPTLFAVPVKPVGVTLTDAGNFTGKMTLTLNYQ